MGDPIDSFLNGETDSLPHSENQVNPQVAIPEPAVATPPDRLDAFLNGDDNALNPSTPRIAPGDIQASLKAVNGMAPDQAARVDQLAKSHGVPFSLVMDHQSDFEQSDEVRQAMKALSDTDENGYPKFPNATEMLSDPVKFAKWRDKIDQLKAIESVIKENQPVPLLNKLNEPYANLRRSAAKVVTQIPEGMAIFNNALFPRGLPLEQLTPEEVLSQNPKLSPEEAKAKADEINALGWQKQKVEDDPLYQFSKAMDAHVEKAFPTDPRLQNSFLLNKVPSVLGMTGGFLATGGLGEIAEASHAVNAAVALTTTAAGAYDEAKAHPGTTDDQAMKAALLTAPTGLLYTIVPSSMLARLFGTAGGKASTAVIKSALLEGGTASVLFPAQGVLSNAVAKNIYDKDRGYWDGQLDQAVSGGVGSTIASIIISAASGHHVPAVQSKQAPHPDITDMVQEHLSATQQATADIARQDSQIKLLTELKDQIHPEAKAEGITEGSSVRDPAEISDFVENSLQSNGHETEMDIDPNAVHEALFQGAKTPTEVDEAQKKLDQFSEDVGVNPDSINKAIQDGTPFKVNTAKLVGMYGHDPVFDKIMDQMKQGRDADAENLNQKQSTFEENLATERKRMEVPTQVKALRDQMMKPADEGGAGKSAQEVDDDLKAVLVPLGNIARQRGETLQQAFDRSGLEVKTGEDGRVFVQRLQGGAQGSNDAMFQAAPAEHGHDDQYAKLAEEALIGDRQFTAPIPLGRTPAIFRELGFKDLPLVVDQEVLKKANNKHQIDVEDLKQLPQQIRDPILVVKSSETASHSGYNVLTEIEHPSGKSVFAALHLEIKKGKWTINDVATISERNDGQVQGWLNQKLLKYVDEKRATDWLESRGLQLPKERTGAVQSPVADNVLTKEQIVNKHGSLFAGDENNPRGAFQPINGKDVIHLFKTHDASTFLHEAHHFIVKEYESLVNSGLADAQTLKDWNTLLDFVGSKDGKLTTAMHEKLADAGVNYYMEGKAPSPGLIDVFRRFKDRLLQLYKQADGLGVKLSDDVRSVFARWHASESEINQANEFYHLKDVIKNLNDTKFKEKQVASKVEKKTAAHEEAVKEAKLKSATLDVDGMPVYRVLNNDKIDLESVKQDFGESVAKELQKKYPSSFSENGSSVHELAIKRGFESPDALVDALRTALPRDEAIKQRHQELIASKEEALQVKDPNAVTPADEETHTQQSLKLLIDDTNRMQEEASHETGKEASQARMAAARKGSQQHQLTVKAYRDSARDTLNKMKAGEAAEYYRFAQAEKRYGAEVVRQLQKGNSKEALASRMKQLFNHAMVLESIKVRAEMQQIQNRYEYRKLNTLLKEGIESEYLSPISTLLARFGLSNRKVDVPYDWTKITELDPVLAAMVPDVVKGQVSGDYRKALTLEELRDVDGFAQTLIHVGRDLLRSMKDAKAMSISDFVGESIGNMSKLSDKKFAAEGTKKAWFQKGMEWLGASTIQQQFLTDMADNFSFRTEGKAGVMRRLYETMVNRQVKEAEMQKDMAKDLNPFFKTLRAASERITKEKGPYFDLKELPLPPELSKVYRGKWTAERLIALMLNTGNEGNLLALKNSYGFKEEHIAAAARMFKGEELKAIQGIWDTINKLYPHIDQAHFDTYNRHIPKVEAQEMTHIDADGKEVKLGGGYYPLKFDSEINTQAGRNAETDLMEQYAGVLRSSKPQDGFTQSRTPGHSLPPLLSLDVLGKHIAESIHYATHADIVRDWNKVTANEEWKRTFTDKFGTRNYEETRQWIKDQAQKAPPLPASGPSRVLEQFFQKQRGIATVAAFGFNVKSGILIHHSLFNAAHALDWKWLASGSRDLDVRTLAGGAGKAWKEIAEMSPYMKDHALSWDRDVRAMSEDLKPGKVGKLDNLLRKASSSMGREFTLQDARKASMILLTTGHQRMAAMVWKGALNKYMGTMADSKLSQADNLKNAIKFADGMVQDTQASSLRAELNALQRDQGIYRFLTAFMSWNFKYGGRLQYEAKAFKEGKISKAEYTSHIIQETLVPALVRTALVGAMGASAPTAWDWIKALPEMITSWVPILKDIPKVFPYSSKSHRVSFDLNAALPITEGGRRIAKAATSTVQVARQTKEVGPMLWDWARATDYITGTGVTKPAQDLYKFYENVNDSENK